MIANIFKLSGLFIIFGWHLLVTVFTNITVTKLHIEVKPGAGVCLEGKY